MPVKSKTAREVTKSEFVLAMIDSFFDDGCLSIRLDFLNIEWEKFKRNPLNYNYLDKYFNQPNDSIEID